MNSGTAAANRAVVERFVAACEAALRDGRFERLLLAGFRGPEPGLKRVTVRAIELRGEPQLSFVYSHERRDETRNWPLAAGLQQLRALIGAGFANAHLHTPRQELQLAYSRKGRASLRSGPREAAAVPGAAHNRDKQRLLSLERPFLAALGVTGAQQRLVPAMARKWKQINKFLEVIDAALAASPLAAQQRLEVLDFGSGKGYLTFALHDHLRHALGRGARVTGVELRPDMVELCNGIVERLGLQGLQFEQGDVAGFAPRPMDLMIALHACDTATDHAMHFGIRGGAAIICCAPCCHKQLRPQLLQPHPLRPILRHGVHLGQEAEMLTDGLRALLLDACGYDTQVFEFVSLEHTAKNKMVLAVKRERPRERAPLLAQLQEVKDFYGIREQCLETLLKADALI
ncbi:MAG TPA: SAM-dependent methyltransferase [Rubrivivax sp.]|nr:SAM-dependent methyltransferase [Rubrivivax sp.]